MIKPHLDCEPCKPSQQISFTEPQASNLHTFVHRLTNYRPTSWTQPISPCVVSGWQTRCVRSHWIRCGSIRDRSGRQIRTCYSRHFRRAIFTTAWHVTHSLPFKYLADSVHLDEPTWWTIFVLATYRGIWGSRPVVHYKYLFFATTQWGASILCAFQFCPKAARGPVITEPNQNDNINDFCSSILCDSACSYG